jgi:hypothetical protein
LAATTAIALMKVPQDDWPPGWRRGPGGRPYSDDAARMADVMNLHAVARSRGWAVFALADGRSDNTAYETYGDALRAKRWDRDRYLYLQIPMGGVPDPAEMQGCLDYARVLHEMGARLPDPRDFHAADRDFPYHAPPLDRADWARQIANLTRRSN